MKKEYHTKQMDTLLEFLKKNADKHYTVYEIADNICFENLGKSTVYRLIGKLVQKGKVKCFAENETKQFVYQYINCPHHNAHLHLKCVDCGKIIHLDTDISEEFGNKILLKSGFSLDEGKTMIYGKCGECN